MALLLPSYYTEAHAAPVTATITASSVSFTEDETSSITFTVTLSDGSLYNGELNFEYSSGLSGPSSATCVDGSATVSVECTASGSQSITVTVPADGLLLESSNSFSYTAASAAVTATITATSASFTVGSSSSITFTVTLSSGASYNGTLNLTYSSGLSGSSSVTCSNGSATVSVSCTSTGSKTITASVPASGTIQSASRSFSYTATAESVSGEVYVEDLTYMRCTYNSGTCSNWALYINGVQQWSNSSGIPLSSVTITNFRLSSETTTYGPAAIKKISGSYYYWSYVVNASRGQTLIMNG